MPNPFHGFRFPPDVIIWAIRWYLEFPIGYGQTIEGSSASPTQCLD